ncbi:MAG TPA: tRNA lysidine(34) synthetase TilS [Thermoanaerobaculia bacterium]|nr:tRNA lysidine(34) synthetase TilS [Thermoanaerobaculia bacterium]
MHSPLPDAIRRFFAARGLEPGHVLVACSGGPDSTALLIALSELTAVTCAHVNHHLRGSDSEDDERFVRNLCARLGVTVLVADGTLHEPAIRRGGIEAAAREVRFARLQELRQASDARWIATAHQKNDQAETILMRLFTGTGLAGLRGIHPVREDGVIRPLLEATRADVEQFLCERGVQARFDRSNDDPRFLRNRIRATLAEYDRAVIDNLAAIAEQARGQWELTDKALLHHAIRTLDPQSRDVSAADLARLADALPDVKRVSVTKTLELLRRGDEIVLRRLPRPTAPFEIPLQAEEAAIIPEIGLTIRVTEHLTGKGQLFRLPDGAEARFTVRNRREGDRFQPLGMAGEKKLKELLIDRKIAAELRDRIPLLVWNGTIVWVAGVEVSERFKATDGARLYEVSIAEEQDQESLQR